MALLFGLLLRRGSLSGAYVTRLGVTSLLAIWVGFAMLVLSRQPWELTLAILKFQTVRTLLQMMFYSVSLIGAGLLLKSLSGLPNEGIGSAAKLGKVPLLLPAVAGLLVAFGVDHAYPRTSQTGMFANYALEEARSQKGQGYTYYLASHSVSGSNPGIGGTASVKAWNDQDLQEFDITWHD